MARFGIAGRVALALLCLGGGLAPAVAARAEADSLMEDFGDILKMYHLYSASDGRTYIEEMPVPAARSTGDLLTYFDSRVQKVTIGYWPDGKASDFHYAGHKNLLIYLQGTQILTTGDGKEYALKPGMVALAEDWTGKGHTYRCVAKTKKKACVLLQVTIADLDREMPLRPPPGTK
jgi:hypothetical protein